MIVIKLRRDTSVKWAQSNPVLAPGEPGYEIDTGKFKIGNGSAKWNDLPSFSSRNMDDVYAQLQQHINSATPHPEYDDGPSLLLLYMNAKV